jgi:hypothetical protein
VSAPQAREKSLRLRRAGRAVRGPLNADVRAHMQVVSGFSWELAVLPNWSAESNQECESIFRPDGVGVLQISSARKNCDVTDDDLNGFANAEVGVSTGPWPVQFGDFVGIELTKNLENAHWRMWFLRNRDLTLFATYNCDPPDRGIEDPDVDQMLSTLKVKDVRSN